MGPISVRNSLIFLPSGQQQIMSALTELAQSGENFDYLGEFDVKFETNLGCESGARCVTGY